MIRDLSVYNAWKRSTLDRMTAKFTNDLMRVYQAHGYQILPAIKNALDHGFREITIPQAHLDRELLRVFVAHQRTVVRVAVSDGIREISPDKKLSTWEKFPYWMPVEETFTTLAEREKRDSLFEKIDKIIGKKNAQTIAGLVDLESKRYLRNIKSIFKTFANDFYGKDPDEAESTGDFAKLIIGDVFDKTKSQTQTIFRTETTRYFNDARVDYFQHETDVDFVQLITVTDGRISEICECRDNYVIPISRANEKQFKPPFHPNCRTIQSPLNTDLKSDQETVKSNLGREFGKVHSESSDTEFTGRRAEPDVPLPKGWG